MRDDYSLSESVGDEIRAMLARRRISGRRLADEMGVSRSWLSYRLTGVTPIDLDDLAQIADALDVDWRDLLPARDAQTATVARLQPRVLTRRRKGGTMLPSSHATMRATRISRTAHTPVAISPADYAPAGTTTRTYGPRTARPLWRHA